MIVAGHDNGRSLATWEIPEARDRLTIDCHRCDQVDQQTLLLICLRNGHLIRINPIRARAAEEEVARSNRSDTVSVLARPRWISLPRQRDGTRKVVGECSGLAAV